MKYKIYRIGNVKSHLIVLDKDRQGLMDFYTEMLRDELSKDKKVKYLFTSGTVRQDLWNREFDVEKMPFLNEAFTLSGGIWRTSRVQRIVNEMIFITQNSVYALHNDSVLRDYKLKFLDEK